MNLSLEQPIAGVLVPVFALRGPADLGIGDTAALIEFIDWSAAHGLKVVKILPINETGSDNSPYNAISSRALDPTTIHISPELIPELATAAPDDNEASFDPEKIDYRAVKQLKRKRLEAAFDQFDQGPLKPRSKRWREFESFVGEQREWLEDYVLFRALMERNGGQETWDRWEEPHRTPLSARQWLAALPGKETKILERKMGFYRYVQWLAFSQWREVKAHAGKKGIALMGDIPFGVSYYSAEVWSRPSLFREDWCGGTPPDKVFKHDPFVQKWGQNWGVPLYEWETMRKDNFSWWRGRVRGIREFFDLFRIDHILGFYRIYSFPWRPDRNQEFLDLSEEEAQERSDGRLPQFYPRPDDTPENQRHNQLDGETYLRAVVEEAGAGRVVGEDLGEVPPYVRPSLTGLGIAGYKIPAWEKRKDGSLIPGTEYQRLSLATYGTHDHDPLKAAWEKLSAEAEAGDATAREERLGLWHFAGFTTDEPSQKFTADLHAAFLRALFGCNSWLAIVMITDLFGRSERFNYPGVADGNWTQRLHARTEDFDSEPIAVALPQLLRETGRNF